MKAQRNNYEDAYNLASEELRRIHDAFEQLSVRHEQMAKVIEALEPRIRKQQEESVSGLTLTSQNDETTFVTRINVTFGGLRL
ncbi:MAG TPA: hypothetical protein VF392_05985 [Terracidiphilus sp.]